MDNYYSVDLLSLTWIMISILLISGEESGEGGKDEKINAPIRKNGQYLLSLHILSSSQESSGQPWNIEGISEEYPEHVRA